MKITRDRLERIIQEELRRVLEQPTAKYPEPIQTAKEAFAKSDDLNMIVRYKWERMSKEMGSNPSGRIAANVTVEGRRMTDYEMLEGESYSTEKTTDSVLGPMKGKMLTKNVPDGTYEVRMAA